jgi:hypothetical protein
MTKGVSARQQHEDRLRLRRQKLAQAAAGLATGAKKPVKAVLPPSRRSREGRLRAALWVRLVGRTSDDRAAPSFA